MGGTACRLAFKPLDAFHPECPSKAFFGHDEERMVVKSVMFACKL